MSRSQTQLVTIHSALSDHETQVPIFPTDNPPDSLDRNRGFPPDHQQSLLDFNPLNGQNFDQVLHKLKQGMKAARGGGWVDINSDSGDELETPTTAPDQDPDVENEEDLTDSSSLSLRLLPQAQPQPTSLNGSSPHHSNPLYSPLDCHSNPPLQRKDSSKTTPLGPLHLSSALNTPTSPFGPITPPPNIGSYPKHPSPYVRHHFKWEFNPASLQPGLSTNHSQQQPRLIETSSTSTHDSSWSNQQHQPLEALLINHHPHHQIDASSMPSATSKASLSNSTRFPSIVQRQNASPAYVRWDKPSEMRAPNSHDRPPEIPRARQLQTDHDARFENLKSCFESLSTGPGISTDSQPESAINPSLISSVSFSLAPTAATVRLTAPSKSPTYDNQHSVNKPVSNQRDRDSLRLSLLQPPSNGAESSFLSSKNQLFQTLAPPAPATATPLASAPPRAQPFSSQNPPLSSPPPSSLSGLFQNMRLSSFPTACAPPSLYATPGPTPPLLGFAGAPAFPALHHYSHQQQPPKTTVPGFGVGPLTPSITTPLPGQVQPEEARKSVKTQPPVVNTGNSGAMVPQPGDWMCMCGFVNWRRRKVCMRCFPFADGNDSVGVMMAMNAQRAALLAAGGTLPDHNPQQPLPTNPATRTPVVDTSTIQKFQQQSTLRQIFGQPKSAGTEQEKSRNPFDNSYPTMPDNELDVSKYKEWDDDDELEISTRATAAARRRSCSLGNYSGVWEPSASATTAAGGGSDEISAGVDASYPGSGIARNNGLSESLNCLTVPLTNSNSNYRNRQRMDTAATSPGSSWQAIRALWQ